MKCRFAAAIVAAAVLSGAAMAEEAAESQTTRILVTFADPGIGNVAPAGPPGPGYRHRSDRYVVSLPVKRAARRIAKEYGLETIEEWPITALEVHCLVYAVPAEVDVDTLLTRLRAEPVVESAQRMNTFHVSSAAEYGSRDPYSELQYVLDTLELPQAHAWSDGAGSEVTIIDTGADLRHPELEGQVRAYRSFVADGMASFHEDPHGTAVAGVIAAAYGNDVGMIGVAPAARLRIVKACWYPETGGSAVCDSLSLARALEYAIASDSAVLNMSLGGPSDALLARLLRAAVDRGAIVVAASPPAGESGFPTEVPGVIVVRPVGDNLARLGWASINAPANDILVPTPAGGYDYWSGSSLAAAHVSGVVALLLAQRPSLAPDRVSALLVSSQRTEDGSINACRALAELLQRTGCNRRVAVNRKD